MLLVEDDPDDRRRTEGVLLETGLSLEVTWTETATGAVDALASAPFDLVLLDLGLPDTEGLEALRMVRANEPDVPIVVTTERDDDELAVGAVRHGAQDHLVKGSFDADLLRRVVHHAVERHRLLQQVTVGAVHRAALSRLESRGRAMASLARFVDDILLAVSDGLPRAHAEVVLHTGDDVVRQTSEPDAEAVRGPTVPAGGGSQARLELDAARVNGWLTVTVPAGVPLVEHEATFLDRVVELTVDAIDTHDVTRDLTRRSRQLRALHAAAQLLGGDGDPRQSLVELADLLVAAMGSRPGAGVTVAVGDLDVAAGDAAASRGELTVGVTAGGRRVGRVTVRAPDSYRWSQEDELVVRQVADLLGLWQSNREVAAARAAAVDDRDRERQRFRRLFEENRDGILLVEEGVVVDANPAYCTLVGRPRTELVGRETDELVSGWTMTEDLPLIRPGAREGDGVQGTAAVTRPDGSRVEVRHHTVRLSDGRTTMSVVRDVTAQRRARRALRASEQQFRNLAQQAVEGIFRLRLVPERQYEYVNPAFVRLTGFDLDDLHEDHLVLRRRTHPDDVVDDAEVTPQRVRFQRADGQWRWLELWQSPLRDERGAVTAVQGVVLDVTDSQLHNERLEAALVREQAATEQLRQLSEMKDAFLRAASHELRTPVASAFGFAQTLRAHRDRLSPDQISHMHLRLERQLDRLRGLLDDLLDLNRITTGRAGEIRRQDIDLAELVAEVAGEVDVPHRQLHLDLEPTPAAVEPGRVERIVHNLLANATKHTPVGTSIWLTTRPDADGNAVLTYADDGPGIDEARRAQLTAPFTQGPGAAAAANPGVGVGLSIIDQFTRLHGGHLELDERPGGGLHMRVVLPPVPTASRDDRPGGAPLRATTPPLSPDDQRVTSKRALLAVSRSIESLASALARQGEPVLLVGLFQESAYFAHSQRTYADLAEQADVVIGYVGGAPHPELPTITFTPDNPLSEQWTVVLVTPRACATLVAHDLDDIGPGRTLEDARLFESRTSTDPADAAEQLRRIVRLARESIPEAARDRLLAAADRLPDLADELDAATSDRLRTTWAELISRTDILQHNEPLAMTDPFTGAYPMTFLNSYLGLPRPLPELGPRSPSLVVVAFGVEQSPDHPAPEGTAQAFAGTVRRYARRGDLLVREDVESWLLVLPGATLDEADGVTRAILGSLTGQRSPASDGAIAAAAAIATYPPTDVDLDELREARDDARAAPGSIRHLDRAAPNAN